MKYFVATSVIIILCLISCKSSSSTPPPSICDCVQNGLLMLAQKSGFDKALQTKCDEYSNTLTEQERTDRYMEGLNCLH